MYTYLLCDNGGVSNSENQFLLPLKSIFRHEFGTYRVDEYRDKNGELTNKFSKITQVICERISK